jgi:hypothetical protein
MMPTRRSRRSAGASLLASALLLAFLGWRAVAIAPRLPSLFNWGGVKAGLSWSPERRVQRAIAQTPRTSKASAAETTAVLAMVREHVEEHAVVIADLERGIAGRQLVSLVAMLAFPRYVVPSKLTEKDRKRGRTLAGSHGLFALVRTDAGQHDWSRGATRVAHTGQHELWRLEDRGQ